MKFINYIAILGVLLSVTSCRENKPAEQTLAVPVFFDLANLVRDDIRKLKADACGLDKTVTIDGKSERQLSDTVNFEAELAPLIESDINKPAWKDLFMADTTVANGLTILRYTSNSDKVKIRTLEITQRGDTVTQVNIRKEISSFAFGYEAQIDYFPGKGYRIHSSQKALLIPKFVMQVQADFTCK